MPENQPKILGGYILMPRQIENFDIWRMPWPYLNVWLWLQLHASFKPRDEAGYALRRGELICTYNEIISGVTAIKRGKPCKPSYSQMREIIKWLVNEGMITSEPIKRKQQTQNADLATDHHLYKGLKIFIVNYDSYQEADNYKSERNSRLCSRPKSQVLKDKNGLDVYKKEREESAPSNFSDSEIQNTIQLIDELNAKRQALGIPELPTENVLSAAADVTYAQVVNGLTDFTAKEPDGSLSRLAGFLNAARMTLEPIEEQQPAGGATTGSALYDAALRGEITI